MVNVFEQLGNDTERWKSVAEALTYNATALTSHRRQHEEDRRHHQEALNISSVDMVFASLVLWGYALECFLKCLYLKTGGLLVENGEFVGWGRKHNLVWMAGEVQFQLTGAQRRVLETLSVIVNWSGRYPIATSDRGSTRSHYWCEPEDDTVLEGLIEALRLEISSH